MKKIFRLFAAFAATTMAFSCMEEANPETGTQNGGSKYEGPMTTIEFTVNELETKTAWDGENHTWSDGDQIKIVYGTEDDAFTVAEVVDGAVTATVGDVDTYYAMYPATAEHRFDTPADATEPKFSVRIPRNQDGSFEMANLMSAQTTKEALSLDFKNLTHIIKFNLTEGHGFEVVEFCANSEVILTGRYFVDVTADGVSMEYNKSGNTNSKYITVNKLGDKSGEFYVGLLPEADMSTGIVLRAKKTGEDYKYYAISMNPLATTRSAITKIGAVDSYLRENVWYITETGTGDGSKGNPAGISKLIELMNKITLSDGTKTKTMHQWRLCNAVIYVAPGTYDIQAANGNANFTPNGLTEYTDLTIVGGPGEGETIFTTGNTVENSRIFHFNAVKTGNLTFKGISFKKAAANAVGLLNFTGAVSGNVTFEDCEISVQTTNNNPGIVRVTPSKKEDLLVNFEGCQFVNNSGSSLKVGAIYATNAQIRINECIFDGNKGTQTGDIQYGTATTLFINRSVFKNSENTYSSSTTYAHATSISNSATAAVGDTLCINNSVFYNNMSKPTTATHRITPAIFNTQRHYMINTSVDNSSYQSLRLTQNASVNINLNNVIVNHLNSYPSIVQSATPPNDYNVMIFGTSGNYKTPNSGDTSLGSKDNISVTWSDTDNNFTWQLLNDVTLAGNTTKANVETVTQTNYPAFDKWLKTVEEDPYGIDFNGNKRNAEKLNPGAWDPGL